MLFSSGDPFQRLHDVFGSRSCGEDLPAFPRLFVSAAVRSRSLHCIGVVVVLQPSLENPSYLMLYQEKYNVISGFLLQRIFQMPIHVCYTEIMRNFKHICTWHAVKHFISCPTSSAYVICSNLINIDGTYVFL